MSKMNRFNAKLSHDKHIYFNPNSEGTLVKYSDVADLEAQLAQISNTFLTNGVKQAIYTAYKNPSKFGFDTPSNEWSELLTAHDFLFNR